MALRVVTRADLETLYPDADLDGFHPTHQAQVRGHHPVDFVFLDNPDTCGIAYGYRPNDIDAAYAVISSGKWQHLEVGGLVDAKRIRYDENWTPLHTRSGHVYFVESGEGGPIKIGWSQDVPRRISELQVANAHKLRLLGVLPGTMAKEREMHVRFSHLRMEAEWFEHVGEIRDFIAKRCQ